MNEYRHLFELCGFDSSEIAAEEPRIGRVFEIISLGAEDIRRAETRIKTYLDTELVGVRKLLRAWMLELFDLVLAKEEGRTVVYYGYPSIQGPGMAIKASSPDTLYVGCPDVILCHTVGLMFDRLTPLLEAAEANGLPAGHGLCSLQQIRNGALSLGIIPVPDLVTGSSYYCDMGSKADELLHQLYGQPSIYIDGCMDTKWGVYHDHKHERVTFYGDQIDKLFVKVREIIGVETTPESMVKAMQTSREMLGALGRMTLLMMADPMPISGVASGMAVNLAGASTGRSMSEGPDAVNTLCGEVERLVARGAGVVEKGSPRVMNFAQHLSDPAVTVMMEKAGLAVAASFVTVPPPKRDKTLQLNSIGQVLARRSPSTATTCAKTTRMPI